MRRLQQLAKRQLYRAAGRRLQAVLLLMLLVKACQEPGVASLIRLCCCSPSLRAYLLFSSCVVGVIITNACCSRGVCVNIGLCEMC